MWANARKPEPKKNLADSLGELNLDDSDLSDSDSDVPFIKEGEEKKKANLSDADSLSSLSGSGSSSEEEEKEDTSNTPDPAAFVSNYEIDPKDIKLGEIIGSGAYGKVYKAKLFGKDVAVKKLTTKFLDEKALKAFGLEVDIMCGLRHPNVVLFMGACTTPGNLTIITELMPRGSVSDLLKDKSVKLSFKQRMSFAKDAALGMNWLHNASPQILHLDLKSANLLVAESWEVKVADFGLSKINRTGANRGLLGSPVYMSPEMLLGLEYDEKTDIYSFGMVLYELVTQQEPFYGEFSDIKQLIDAVVKQDQRPKLPPSCPPRLAKLIKSCWETVPSKRPSFEEMLSGEVFERVTIEALIHDKKGCALWTQFFLGKDVVSWDDFEKAFYQYFELPLESIDPQGGTKMQYLKAIIADKEKQTVKIEDFSRALECFGPMENVDFVNNIGAILREPWFFGDLTEAEADEVLTPKKAGTYLVRFSSEPGCFTITTKNQKDLLAHYRIKHKPGLPFLVGSTEHPSIQDVIKKGAKKMYLKRPCPGSKFQDLFTQKTPLRDLPSFYSLPPSRN